MKLKKILLSNRKNSLRQKIIFTLSFFALGLVATGRFEKQRLQQNNRNPASETRPQLEEEVTLSQITESIPTCEYTPESHKICASQVKLKKNYFE